MPLPSDLSTDLSPHIMRDEETGDVMVMTRDGLAATFMDGKWQPGRLMVLPRDVTSREWPSDVGDPVEREEILAAAVDALRDFKRKSGDL